MASNDTVDMNMDFNNFITPWPQRIVCSILFTILGSYGVITNMIAIALTIFTDLRHKKVNVLVANLAASGFLQSVIFVMGQNFYILYREKMPGSGCSWLGTLNFVAAMQEYVFPPVLAINRYMGLYHTQSYDHIFTSSKIAMMAIITWGISTIIPIIFGITGHTGFDRRNEHCCVIVEGSVIWTVIYWLVVIGPLVGVVVPVMVFCNWNIYKKLKEHSKMNGQMLKDNIANENREIMYFMIIDMLIPICVHTVYHVAKFVVTQRVPLVTRIIFTSVYLGNTGFRGMLILLMLRPYREAFKKYILRRNQNTVAPSESILVKSRTGAL